MRTLRTFFTTTLITCTTLLQLNAQNDVLAFNSKTNTNTTTSDPKNAVTPEQARKKIVSMLVSLKNTFGAVAEPTDESALASSKQAFLDFILDLEKKCTERIKTLEAERKFSNQTEIAKCYRALNIAYSAICLAEKNDGNFVQQRDVSGEEIVAHSLDAFKGNARYGLVDNYSEGYARIKKDQVFGFLNYCGDEVIQCQYEKAERFNNGKALVKKVQWHFLEASGKLGEPLKDIQNVTALKNGVSIAEFSDSKFALIQNDFDVTSKTVSEKYDEILPFVGFQIFKIRNGNKWGLMNIYGQVKFSPNFETIGEVADNGLARVQEDGKFRLISLKTFKSTDAYATINDFDALSLARIKADNGTWGLLNDKMEVVVSPKYFSIGEFNEFRLAPTCIEDKRCGYMNNKGEEVISPVYDEVGTFSRHGVVVVKELTKECNKNKMCKTDIVYTRNGQILIAKPKEGEVSTMKISYEVNDTLHSDKFIVVKMFVEDQPQGFHLIKAHNLTLITKSIYQNVSAFDTEGNFRIKYDELWGIMDTNGNVLLEPVYKEIRRFSDNFYPAKNNDDKIGFLDKKGKAVIPFEYKDVKFFKNSHCIVSNGKGKWGLINKFDAKIVPLDFVSVTVKAKTYELTDEDGTIFIIDDKGDCQGSNCVKFEKIRQAANKK
jgi:hypothetical protein